MGDVPSPRRAVALSVLGTAQLRQGRAAEALASLRESDRQFATLQSAETPDRVDLRIALAEALAVSGAQAEADQQLAQAEAYWSSRPGDMALMNRLRMLRQSLSR